MVRLDDGRILVAGSGAILELLDAKASGFRTAGGAALDGELSFTTTTLLHDGRVLIAGGYSPDIHPSRSAWLYQPEN